MNWKTLCKLKRSYYVDWAAINFDNSICGWVEFKKRTTPKLEYSTYMISAQKINSLLSLAQLTEAPCYLVVQWSDEFGVCSNFSDCEMRIGGRMDRNDPEDYEPCYMIPIERFRAFTGKVASEPLQTGESWLESL
jgi:hypothetical protein